MGLKSHQYLIHLKLNANLKENFSLLKVKSNNLLIPLVIYQQIVKHTQYQNQFSSLRILPIHLHDFLLLVTLKHLAMGQNQNLMQVFSFLCEWDYTLQTRNSQWDRSYFPQTKFYWKQFRLVHLVKRAQARLK